MPGNGLTTEVVAGTTTMLTTTQPSMQHTGMENHESGKSSCSVESLPIQFCPSLCHATRERSIA